MKGKILLLILIIFLGSHFSCFSQEREISPQEFILDYNVPESPGFTVLGVNPNKVVTGANAKPLAINVLGQFGFKEKLTPGFAMDFTPMIFGITFINRNEYKNNDLKRILANTSFSLAAVKDKIDTNSTKFGLGIRVTLFDQSDLLMDEDACLDIEESMVEYPDFNEENDNISIREIPALKKAFLQAKNKILNKTGHSLSIGYGLEGMLKNSIINKDSIIAKTHSIWIAGQSSFKGFRVLYTYQSKFGMNIAPENLLGAAIRTNKLDLNATAELLYNFQARKFEGALTGEMKIVNNFSVIVGISIENEYLDDAYKTKLNLVSNLRYNLGN